MRMVDWWSDGGRAPLSPESDENDDDGSRGAGLLSPGRSEATVKWRNWMKWFGGADCFDGGDRTVEEVEKMEK